MSFTTAQIQFSPIRKILNNCSMCIPVCVQASHDCIWAELSLTNVFWYYSTAVQASWVRHGRDTSDITLIFKFLLACSWEHTNQSAAFFFSFYRIHNIFSKDNITLQPQRQIFPFIFPCMKPVYIGTETKQNHVCVDSTRGNKHAERAFITHRAMKKIQM